MYDTSHLLFILLRSIAKCPTVRVCIYNDRAEVTRKIETILYSGITYCGRSIYKIGQQDVTIENLSTTVDTSSIRVAVIKSDSTGTPTVLEVQLISSHILIHLEGDQLHSTGSKDKTKS